MQEYSARKGQIRADGTGKSGRTIRLGIEADYLDFERMRVAVCQQRKERGYVDFWHSQVERVDANNRPPESWDNSACEDDWERPDYPAKCSVDIRLAFTKRRGSV